MFFMMGIMDGQKNIDFEQEITCSVCGCYGRFQVFMTYTVLSIFFIPCFKWNKRYYVKTTCCGTLYELDPAIGKRIEHGEKGKLEPCDLRMVKSGFARGMRKRCENCGFETEEAYDFCPKCGRSLS